jgi:hypothetical protein
MLRRILALMMALAVAGGLSTPAFCATSYAWPGGHVTLGATTPSDQWYFAEGCTRPGFDAWLCVMNPQTETALVDISFLTPGGQEAHITDPLPPLSRYTINVAEVVGEDLDVSMVVESDLAVVAERPMYFGYLTPCDPTAYLLAESAGLELICPVSYQETIGIMYHEASRWDIHNREAYARALIPLGGCVGDANPGAHIPGWTPQRWGDPYYWVQESRGRGTWSTSAVDVGAEVGCRAVSPVDGVVEAAEAFNLYGIYPDMRVAIIPDGRPDLRIVLLHLEDIRVAPGTRVKAGETMVGRVRPLSLYFQSDIGSDYTGDEGNHVHLQINLAPVE